MISMPHAKRFSKSGVAIAVACALLVLATGCNNRMSGDPLPDLKLASAIRSEIEAGVAGPEGPGPTAEPTGWATLKGSFKVNGAVPPRKALNVTKDESVCAPGGKSVPDNDVVVGPNGELANVLIFLSSKTPDDPKWIHESYAATKNASFDYDQKACLFLTHVFALRSTQTLKILNSDSVSHNANLTPKGNAKPLNVTIPPGGSAPYVPGGDEPGAFPVACGVHPWMKAWLISRNNPYFAVTKTDGTFEIANLPAGVDLEFRVWQENLQGVEAVGPKGKYKVKLENEVPKELNVVIEASAFK